MAMTKYGRLDTTNVRATKGQGGRIYSVLAENELQNGMIGKVGDIIAGENDVREFQAVTNAEVGTAGVRVAFISTPEVNYKDDSVLDRVLVNFKIPSGEIADAVPVESGDELAISEGMITLDTGVTSIENVKYLTIGSDMKLKGVVAKPSTGFVAKVDKVKAATRQTFYGSNGQLIGLSYKMVYFTVNVA